MEPDGDYPGHVFSTALALTDAQIETLRDQIDDRLMSSPVNVATHDEVRLLDQAYEVMRPLKLVSIKDVNRAIADGSLIKKERPILKLPVKHYEALPPRTEPPKPARRAFFDTP